MNALKQRVDEALSRGDVRGALVPIMTELLREQQAEIERLTKDAERYRWFRRQDALVRDCANSHCLELFFWDGSGELDSAVDAAILEENGNG